MRLHQLALLTLVSVGSVRADLTAEQKLIDFRTMAGWFAENYAPYEWKRDVIGVDLTKIDPWLDRVRRSRSDIEFAEICMEYVASLRDAHNSVGLYSNFFAQLPFHVDIYDGKPLIDSIIRTALPAAQYPFQIGDELVALDGRPAAEWIAEFSKYLGAGNPRTIRRLAAQRLISRSQSAMPRAPEVPQASEVQIRRANGDLETYTITWTKSGRPFTSFGRVPGLAFSAPRATGAAAAQTEPEYLRYLKAQQFFELPAEPGWQSADEERPGERSVLGYGSRFPAFSPPAGFQTRLGNGANDFYLSGTYQAGGKRIGLIRIPTWSLSDAAQINAAAAQFNTEINFFQANTDGLVVDHMRNPGGNACSYQIEILRRLIPYRYKKIGLEYRATWLNLYSAQLRLDSARAARADQWIIDTLQLHLDTMEKGFNEGHGRTGALPVCGDLTFEVDPLPNAYTKPILFLNDELDASAADIFAATVQDAGRGPIMGMRTMGAGTSFGTQFLPFSNMFFGVSVTIYARSRSIKAEGYPETVHVENVGVHPDIPYDLMTRENLMTGGRPFVEAFTAAILAEIDKAARP